MLKISNSFKNDTVGNISSIHTCIMLFPDCPVEKYKLVSEWISSTGDSTGGVEILDDLINKYQTKKNYINSIIKVGTKSVALQVNSHCVANFMPIVSKNPKFRNKLNLKTRVSKINNLTFTTVNNYNGMDLEFNLESCNKSAVAVFWVTPSAKSLSDCTHVYTGYLDQVELTSKNIKYTCYHLSKFFANSDLPTTDIPYADVLPNESKNKPYPLVYGEVNGAYAAVTKKEFLGSESNTFIEFDKPGAECEGFVTEMRGITTSYTERKELANKSDKRDIYSPDEAQIYIGRDGKMLTLMQTIWVWNGGNPDTGYVNDAMISSGGAEKDVQDGYAHRYYLFPQYDYNSVDNGIRARALKNEPRRLNTIANNAAFVQYKDNFKGVLMQPHEGGGANTGTIQNGLKRIGYIRSDFATNSGLQVGWNFPTTNPLTDQYVWVNNGEIDNLLEFFDKGSYVNRDKKLKFRFFTTYQSWSKINDNDTDNIAHMPTFRGLRCGFESELDSVNSYRIMNFLHFDCQDTVVQHYFEDKKFNDNNDVVSHNQTITVPSGTAGLTTNSYPFGAATGSMKWFLGTYKTNSDDTYGDVPYLYPGRDRFDTPCAYSTRQIPQKFRAADMSQAVPISIDNDNTLKNDIFQFTTDLEMRQQTKRAESNDFDSAEGYGYNDDEFYTVNSRLWQSHWDNKKQDYQWWSNHGNYGFSTYPPDVETWGGEDGQNLWLSPINGASGNWSLEEGNGVPSMGTLWNDGALSYPDPYMYSDNLDTTLMVVPIYPPQYNTTLNQTDENTYGPPKRSHIQHAYHEIEFNDLYCVRQFIVDEFYESDFFANVKGRKGYKNFTTSTREFIQNPADIIYDILNTELELGRNVIDDEDSYFKAQSQNSNIQTAFSIKERKESNLVIEEIVKDSKLILKNSENGAVVLDSIKNYYNDQDVNVEINSSDILNYKIKKTKIEDIKNQVKIDYNLNYSNDQYENTSGSIVNNDGTELYPIIIDGVVKRSTFTLFSNGQINNADAYSYDDLTKLMYPSHPEYHYDVNYYNMKGQESKFKLESKTVRDLSSAHYLQKYSILSDINQHLLINLDLPLKYVGVEVGDIIRFDKLMDDQKAFDFDYTKRYLKNGQIIYPYFMVTSTDKDISKIKIECIQLHRMDWGVDGIEVLDNGDDRTYIYSSNTGDWIPTESGIDDNTQFMYYTPQQLTFPDTEEETKSIEIYDAYSSITSVTLLENTWVAYLERESNAQTGRHTVKFITTENNEFEESRSTEATITFDSGDELIIPITQVQDFISPDWYVNFMPSGYSDVTNETIEELDYMDNGQPLPQPFMRVYPNLQNVTDGDTSFNPETCYGTVIIQWIDDSLDQMQYVYDKMQESAGDYYYNSVPIAITKAYSQFREDQWGQNFEESNVAVVHNITEPMEVEGFNTYQCYISIVIVDRFYRDTDGDFIVNCNGETKTYPGLDFLGESRENDTLTNEQHFQITIWKPTVFENHTGGNRFAGKTYDDAIKVFNVTQSAFYGEDPHDIINDEEEEEQTELIDTGYGSGDFNSDNFVNVLDVVQIMDNILGSDEPNLNLGDINSDDVVNVLDVVIIVGFITDGYGADGPIPSWYPEESEDMEGNT